MRGTLSRLSRFGPPIAWMAVIAGLSSSLLGADRTESYAYAFFTRLLPGAGPHVLAGLHAIVRKMGHVVEYGILAALWLRALAPDRSAWRAAAWAVGLSALYAVVDEIRQGLTPNRSPSVWDVGIDTVGAALAVALRQAPGPFSRGIAGLARWAVIVLAAGSLLAAVVDWSLGLTIWDLVLAALGLVLTLWILGRLERAWRSAP